MANILHLINSKCIKRLNYFHWYYICDYCFTCFCTYLFDFKENSAKSVKMFYIIYIKV